MKTKLTEWLVKPLLNESPDLDIKVGDDILMGRFKNKRVKVKSITYNEKGDLLINGRPALKFRKVKNKKKLLPSKTTKKPSVEPDSDRKGVDDEYPHHKTEGFGGELSKSDKKKFEKERVENAEVLGYELTGTTDVKEAKRVPRKKGQHRGSKSHSDLYTDENPKGTIKGLKFATVDDAKKSVSKIRNSGRSHAHKIQAAVAMEQRAREMGKTSQAAVYRAYINQMKKKTKKNEIDFKDKDAFQKYNAKHKMRPTTKVNIAGKDSTVGDETQDNWETIDNKKNYVKTIRDYTDKEYQEETGEYFDNKKTMKVVPNAFKDEKDMIEKMKSARTVYLSSEKMEFMDNTDVGDILNSNNALELGKEKAKEYGKDWDRLEKGIKSGSDVPPPIAMKDKNGDYYLLAGNTRMMSFTASGKKLPIKVIDYDKEFQYDTNESFFGLGAGDIPSPSRKGVKKMKKKGNTSVPYGSGYKKVNEQKEVKKVVVIYPGRFQPFGPHHKKVFDALQSKFGEAYITTSDIKQPPRHPMNFNEKVRHMVKMGVPKNRIFKERVPYVANNLLRKFNKDTTAVVYVFGAKDAGRLKGGKKKSGGLTYYQDLKSNINNLKGFEEHGYIYTAPTVKVSGISSGTEIRNLLGSPKFDDKKREQIFKKTFGYFDKGVYTMMTNKFKKLFEFFQQPQVKKLMKEVSGFGSHFKASDMSDEGMYDFFGSLDDYYRVSPEHADVIGYELIDHPIRDSEDMMFTIMADEYEKDRTKTVTHGRTINQNRKNTDSVDNPFPKYKERMRKTLGNLGFEIVKYFGEESFTKMKESPLLVKNDVKKGVDHIKKVQESFQQDVDLLIEAMCGVGQNPADTGCTPKGKAKTKPIKQKPYKPLPGQPKVKKPSFDIKKMMKQVNKNIMMKRAAKNRPDRKPNMKNGVDVMRNPMDDDHFIGDFLHKTDKGVDIEKRNKNLKNQWSELKKKLTPKEQKQLREDVLSWKQLGGFEAIEEAIRTGETTEQEIRDRNERISDLSHKTITKVDTPIERGISVPNEVADEILSNFKVGEMVGIVFPKDSGVVRNIWKIRLTVTPYKIL